MARKALIHKNTNLTTNNGGVLSPKLPTAGTLQKGEIAVNYKDGYETLSIENDLGEVVPFASLEQTMAYTDASIVNADWNATSGKAQILNKPDIPDEKLSSSYQTSTLENDNLLLAGGDTYETAFSKIEKAILDNEETIAASLNDLNTRKIEIDDVPTKTSQLTNDSNFTTLSEVTLTIINSAPTTLDTLKELADALGNDPNFATTVTTQIGNKADRSNMTAGTYKSVTVNNQGIITAGTNPTTLAGYGITDAAPAVAGGYLPLSGGTMIGTIERQYNDASNEPVLKVGSHNKDIQLFKVYSNDVPYSDTVSGYGYSLQYNGQGAGIANYLRLIADNQTNNTKKTAISINQSGLVGILADPNISYSLYVNGNTNINGNLTAAKFITSGGNSNQAVLGNGDLKNAKELPQYEAYLEWGGKNFNSSYGPIDAALISNLGANRFAFIPSACVTIEYSNDGGTTWLDYEASTGQKAAFFAAPIGNAFYLGKHNTKGSGSENDRLRITVDTYNNGQKVYSTINKFACYMSTNGAANCKWTMQVRKTSDVINEVDTWTNVFTDVAIGGWSGINIANYTVTLGSNNPTSNENTQYRQFRFIFSQGTTNANYYSSSISYISAYGGVGWATPSNMAKYNSIYSYDGSQNAFFPAMVQATSFKKTGGTSSQFLKADGSVDSNTYLTSHQLLKTINNESIVGTGNLAVSGLPTVTASDNGKILLVVNGAWALVTPTVT